MHVPCAGVGKLRRSRRVCLCLPRRPNDVALIIDMLFHDCLVGGQVVVNLRMEVVES
jgi:hypothetical protein